MPEAYTRHSENMENLEAELRRSLKPVKPSQDFVEHLQTRLAEPTTMTIERRSTAGLSLLLVALSLLSGVMIVWGMRRMRTENI